MTPLRQRTTEDMQSYKFPSAGRATFRSKRGTSGAPVMETYDELNRAVVRTRAFREHEMVSRIPAVKSKKAHTQRGCPKQPN